MLAPRALEFDRVVDDVTALAITPLGSVALSELEPSTDPKVVVAAQASTTETVKFLERHPLFPLRAGEALPEALDGLDVQGRPLEPLQLRLHADFVDLADQSRACFVKAGRGAAAAAARRFRRLSRSSARQHWQGRRGLPHPARPGRARDRVQGGSRRGAAGYRSRR